jgi:hypothetical protein
MNYKVRSAFTRGGNIITPETITIDDRYVRWSRNRGIKTLFLASNNITILRSKIVGVEVIEKIIGADIIISSFGASHIYASKFTAEDAQHIRDLLM